MTTQPCCRLLVDTSTQQYSVFLVCLFLFVFFFFRKISKKNFSKAKGNAFAFVHQHGRRYVTCMFSLGLFIYFLNFNCTCISTACEENVF